jgi:iron-sulfur cluster repair protein YtfE (RIC family)
MLDVKRELHRDHEDHLVLLEQLAFALESSQPPEELRCCFRAFEENLFDHLETEERHLFTVAAQAHRREIAQLRSEHERIRQSVELLNGRLETSSLRKQAIDDLRALLQAHSAHEERSLHRWLEIDEGILAVRGVHAIRTRRERASARMRVAAKVSA